jgi:hypothetical protein
MQFIYSDGGRKAAGFKGSARDCATRAIAIASGLPYLTVYNGINLAAMAERNRHLSGGSSARTGVYRDTLRRYLASLGWKWTPTMQIGSGCKVHLRKDELPAGRLIVNCSRHIVAVIDGVVFDTHDPTREGTRCVYGYWHR